MGRNPRSLTLRKHRMEPASDPATARSARNRKSKITCGGGVRPVEDPGGEQKAMEQIDGEQAYLLDGGLDDGGLGGGSGSGSDGVAVGPAHDPVAADVLGRRRHLAGRRGGGRRRDGHGPPPRRRRRREQPGPRRGRVDGWRGAAAQHQERHRVACCALRARARTHERLGGCRGVRAVPVLAQVRCSGLRVGWIAGTWSGARTSERATI